MDITCRELNNMLGAVSKYKLTSPDVDIDEAENLCATEIFQRFLEAVAAETVETIIQKQVCHKKLEPP